MTLHYKLLPHTLRGILTTPETPLLDTDSGFLLQFDLPEPGEYVVALTGQDGREVIIRLEDGKTDIPPHMLKPQLIAVAVLQLKDAKPVKRWVCPAIRITSLVDMGKLMLQAVEDTAGLSEDIKWLYGAVDRLQGENAEIKAANVELRTELSKRREEVRAEVSEDIAGLVAYKASVAKELQRIVEAVNDTNKEIAAIKSEFSL